MDRYEFNIKVEQMKKLMKKKDFVTAVKIADTIDWERVRENQLLIMAADVYEIAGRYDDARDVLLLAYEKTGLGRQLAYRLCRLSVKRGDMGEAEEFYEEFTQNSPRDAGKYILQYEMAKGRGESIEKQIEILEAYIEEDMDDRWAYELAKLYHKAHLRDKCVEQCDTIILWFADGKYVEKAMELKQLYVPLSENQRLKYEAQKSRRTEVKNDIVPPMQMEEEEAAVPERQEAETAVPESQDEAVPEKLEDEAAVPEKQNEEVAVSEKQDEDILDEVHEADIDVNEIHVKDFSVNNKYDTMNLQRELAQSMKNLFDNTIEIFKPNVKKEEPEEESVEDDQIEGQMSLDEVLAMFESGELKTREESAAEKQPEEVKEPETEKQPEEEKELETENQPETVESVVEEISSANDSVEDDVDEVLDVQEVLIEDEEIEELEDIEDEEDFEAEEIDEDVVDETIGENDIEESDINEEAEDDGFGDISSDEELLADIIAREIQIDISEEIDSQIDEAGDENEELDEEYDDVEELEEEAEEIKETEEEYSEAAESKVQESNPIMFDLKEDLEGDIIKETVAEDSSSEEADEADIDDEEYDEDDVIDSDEASVAAAKPEKSEQEKPAPAVRASIQSETAKEELKNFIARFAGVQGLDKQILKVMQTTLKVEKSPVKFIFVKGEVKSGKTTLAIEVLKLANKIMQRRDQKIAKIKAESINGKSIDGLLSKLDGSDVLIEKVSGMETDAFVEFIDKLNAEGRERFVIFEDEKSLADAFLEKVPESHREFANVLDIRQNKIKDWTKMASDYAKQQGYTFDEMGTLALSAKIDQLRAITLVVHKNHVEQLVDGAIKNYNKFSFGKLFRKFTEKNEDGLKVLTEKDFMD